MKLSTIIGMLALAPTIMAGTIVKNYEQAQPLVGEDGYILVAYGDGWDHHSEKNAKKLLAAKEFLAAGGNAVYMSLGIPQVSTEETKAAQATVLGKLKLPKPRSYPAIFLFDKNGRHYATISGKLLRKAPVDKVSQELKTLHANGLKQQELLRQAASANGVAKARLLGQAATLPNINRPDNVINQLKQADPKDESGYIRRLEHNPWDWAERCAKLPTEEALAKMDEMLADPAFTNDQKQKLCATYIGCLYHSGNPDLVARIPEMAQKMKAYNPDDVQAQSAPIVIRDWYSAFGLEHGWSPATLPTKDSKPAILSGAPSMEVGSYAITFTYTRGTDRLNIAAVELYDGATKISEDRHAGYAGSPSNANTYTITTPKAIRNPRILIYLDMKGKRNTNGIITMEKK